MIASEFENHPVFEKLDQIIARFSEQEVRDKIELEKLHFYDSSCRYIKDRLRLTIPVLVPIAELNTISQEIDSGIGQVNTYIGNNSSSFLNFEK